MLHICPRLPGQRFEDPPLEEEILSFIRDLGHTREIKVLTGVNVNYMHQPWRSFAAIINRCLSGKTIGLDSLRLSRPVNIKKHTARDDPMFNTIRVISRHLDTQVYDAILPAALTNQEMLDSKAYKEYYTVASRVEPPKAKTKYKKKADEPVTSPKSKTASASKGIRLKSKAKVSKPNIKKQLAKKIKAKGLAVLPEVALSEAEQIKLATKKSKKDFHISHASGSGDGVDTQSKVPNEQVQNTFGIDEGTGTIPGVPDVPSYESESDKESWGDSEDEDDDDDDDGDDDNDGDDDGDNGDDVENQTKHEEEDVDEGVRTPFDNEFTNEEKLDDEEIMNNEEDNEVLKELYEDVNVNLEKGDVEMTDANQRGSEQLNVSQELRFEQEEEDAHVTLTPVFDAQKADEPVQSSSVSSDFTSKFLNLENPSLADNEIASLMETSAPHDTAIPKIISSFTTTTPPPPSSFNPLLHQQTSTITTPTFKTITPT
nr:hypothetical protein [Tanacetum cinerariifolium]